MKMTEAEFAALQSRTKDPLQSVIQRHGFTEGKVPGKKPEGETLRLILPFKLPTWNALLAMDHWQRARVRGWIKKQVSMCIASGEGSQTPTGFQRKLSLTPLSLAEYSEMIMPASSKKYHTAKKSARKKRL